MTRALYPGSFDPIHNGHIDIATRASTVFDELIVAIYDAPPKKNVLFSTEERLDMARRSFVHLPHIQVTTYTGLTVDCAHDEDAQVIIRGLRNVADFEYEHQIGWANRQMAHDIELCCFFCDGNFAYLSATILKEVASLGGDFSNWAPPHVQQALSKRIAETQKMPPTKRRSSKLAHHA